jgi:hypothetical protein
MEKTHFQMILDVKDYCPKDDMFTSKEEIDMLAANFGLDKMSILELRNLRDMVVMFWTNKMREERYRNNMEYTDEYMRLSHAVQSITAVIDMYFYAHRQED